MLQSLAAQALAIEFGTLPAYDQDVGPSHQFIERRLLGRRKQAQPDSALVGVEVQEHPARVRIWFTVGERAMSTVAVTLGWLHLHHICAGVAKQPGAEGGRRHLGVLQDLHACEGRGRCCAWS